MEKEMRFVGAPLADSRIAVKAILFLSCGLRLLDEAGASASGAPTLKHTLIHQRKN